jgi:hypothetical protein
VVWALSSFCRGSPKPAESLIKMCLGFLAGMLPSMRTEASILDCLHALALHILGENKNTDMIPS